MAVRIHTSLRLVLMFLILTCLISSFSQAFTINPEIEFIVGNETYSVNQTMEFSSITIDSSYIIFNSTGFYVNSVDDVSITLVYINDDISSASNGDNKGY